MAITKDPARQYPLAAQVTFTGGTDVGATGTYEAIDLPPGARVVGGNFRTTAGFTGNGTVAVHIGSVVLLAAADYDAAAAVPFTGLGPAGTAADTVDVVVAVAALTDGTGVLTVEYVIEDRSNEVQG